MPETERRHRLHAVIEDRRTAIAHLQLAASQNPEVTGFLEGLADDLELAATWVLVQPLPTADQEARWVTKIEDVVDLIGTRLNAMNKMLHSRVTRTHPDAEERSSDSNPTAATRG